MSTDEPRPESPSGRGPLARRDAAPTPRQRELRRAAEAVRLVIDRLVATGAPDESVRDAADRLQEVAGALEGWPRGGNYEGFPESSTAGTPTAFFDNSPLIGRANPLAPPIHLEVVEGEVRGGAVFGGAYEGPPGCVHGGYIAAAFDEVLGMAQTMAGSPGMTGTLTVRYRSPTPLHRELTFRGRLDRVEGRKILTSGTLHVGDVLCAEAEAVFITVDFARMRAPADEGHGTD